MLFSSPIFLFLFLPSVICSYFLGNLVFGRKRIGNLILVLASLLFYSWGEGGYVVYILATIFINYLFGLLISRSVDHKKLWLTAAIFSNLVFLFYFKYLKFLFSIVTKLQVDPVNANFIADIHMPLGVSFVTFHVLSYLLDTYWGKIKAEKNLHNLALYILLFPHLIAGPIVRYSYIGKQIKSRHITMTLFVSGINRFIIGLGKKVIIANTLAQLADRILILFPHQLNPQILWLGLIAYTLQIYFDFSGYSDMAIGLARMFGFQFKENFNFPYLSSSIQDFWRRWHMTLSGWFRDYLYIPLGGNRKGPIRTCFNIMFVFFLTGLWHGANWNFIFWGVYYGAFLVFERLIVGEKLLTSIWLPIRHIYALLIITIGWLFFRVENLSYAFYLLKMLFGLTPTFSDFSVFMFLNPENSLILAVGIIMAASLPHRFIHIRLPRLVFPLYRFGEIVFLATVLIYSIMALSGDTYNPFIYFRF